MTEHRHHSSLATVGALMPFFSVLCLASFAVWLQSASYRLDRLHAMMSDPAIILTASPLKLAALALCAAALIVGPLLLATGLGRSRSQH